MYIIMLFPVWEGDDLSMNWESFVAQKGLVRVQEFGQVNNGWVRK